MDTMIPFTEKAMKKSKLSSVSPPCSLCRHRRVSARRAIAVFVFCFVTLGFLNESYAQNSKKERDSVKAREIETMVEAKDYVFQAQSASPLKGGIKQLTSSGYFLSLMDTLICNLPYYGQVYQSSYGTTDGGIKFTSADFSYAATNRKKGGWSIKIKTKDQASNRQLALTIFENGNASLQITSSDRQSISYSGYVEKPKP